MAENTDAYNCPRSICRHTAQAHLVSTLLKPASVTSLASASASPSPAPGLALPWTGKDFWIRAADLDKTLLLHKDRIFFLV